ncbi:cysteine desulfurase [Microvirga sp. KLBC 81]|uniref:cysteine desulfurase family protein n=1 Tax=Microvirga sp. KLBC 81 TaxID=1862707 RepID=UPI000D511F79|nr:cysteine desulfurase family protein [Microvirga sp. KLBC 81]PVE22834.1 cysteine desulfurase [Microvirga sp. KLBC 81]
MIYLDANATTAASESVVAAVFAAMRGALGNPSSIHAAGADARNAITRARDEVCLLIPGALPEGVIFTSGGTEGNNAVLRGIPNVTIVTTNVEHPSVLRPAEAAKEHCSVRVGRDGTVDPQAVADVLPPSGEVIVSIQWANSETGVIQPISDIIGAVRARRPDTFIHVDAAQAIGRIPIRIDGIDALTFSGHKIHGPQGTGALVLGDPDETRLKALILGGGQEGGRRSGTQNVPGAVGLGVAIREREEAFESASRALKTLRDVFERAVLEVVPGSKVNGGGSPRVPNTSNILFPGIEAMAMVARLDQRDVACSVGAACSSGRPEPSHVLSAMGLSEDEAYSSVRFSFSVMNSVDEALRAADIVAQTARELR